MRMATINNLYGNPLRAFDEKVESTMDDSQDGANQIQRPHWGCGGQS
jgi:hypothetical protein